MGTLTPDDSPVAPSQTDDEQVESPIVPKADALRLLPHAQLGLRLLGVLMFFDGAASFVGGGAHAMFDRRLYQLEGYEYTLDPHSIGWMAQGVPLMLGGLYLMLSGRWLLANIFSPPQESGGAKSE